jgi:hypothetical protein
MEHAGARQKQQWQQKHIRSSFLNLLPTQLPDVRVSICGFLPLGEAPEDYASRAREPVCSLTVVQAAWFPSSRGGFVGRVDGLEALDLTLGPGDGLPSMSISCSSSQGGGPNLGELRLRGKR